MIFYEPRTVRSTGCSEVTWISSGRRSDETFARLVNNNTELKGRMLSLYKVFFTSGANTRP
jgi:hypothetical protein